MGIRRDDVHIVSTGKCPRPHRKMGTGCFVFREKETGGTHRGRKNYSITILSRSTLNTKNQEHNRFVEKSCNFVL